MVGATLRMIDPNVAFTAVRASRGKVVRAEPVAALYQQGRVHHIGTFPQLEDQMTNFTSDIDRAAAGLLLVRTASGFAVIESRNGWIYPISPSEREGVPMTGEAIAMLLADQGDLPEDEARRLFDELCERGERFAQSLR